MKLFRKDNSLKFIFKIEILLLVSFFFAFFITKIFKTELYRKESRHLKNISERYRMFSRIENIPVNDTFAITDSISDDRIMEQLNTIRKSEELIKEKKYLKAERYLNSFKCDRGWIDEYRNRVLIKSLYLGRNYRGVIRAAKKGSRGTFPEKYLIRSYLRTGKLQEARTLFVNTVKNRSKWGLFGDLSKKELKSLMKGEKNSGIFENIAKRLISLRRFSIYNKIKKYIKNDDLVKYLNAEMFYARKKYGLSRKLLRRITDPEYSVGKEKLMLKMAIRDGDFSNIDEKLKKISTEKETFKMTLMDIASILKIKGEFSLAEKYYHRLLKIPDIPIREKNYWKALWRIGWINMRSGRRKDAISFFRTGSKSPVQSYKIANLYWKNKLTNSPLSYITEFPYSYYYSKYSENIRHLKKFELKNFIKLIDGGKPSGLLKEITVDIEKMLKYGFDNASIRYINWIKGKSLLGYADLNTLKIIESIIHLRRSDFYLAFSSFKSNFPNYQSILLPNFLRSIYTPVKYKSLIEKFSKKNGLDKNIVFALIRRESFFNKRALSHANAIGLMQLLTNTAKKVSRNLNIRIRRRDLFKPEINIQLGIHHLKRLIDRYNGKKYLALAAYNAGSHRVDKWIQEYKGFSEEEFIEMIPFTETRNYVKSVLKNYYFYSYYYN